VFVVGGAAYWGWEGEDASYEGCYGGEHRSLHLGKWDFVDRRSSLAWFAKRLGHIHPGKEGEGTSFASVSDRLAVVAQASRYLSQRRVETSEAPKMFGLSSS
jgi:hypothetical protein